MGIAVDVHRAVDDDGAPDDALLVRAVRAALAAAAADGAGFGDHRGLAISIVGADASRALNAQWRGKDKPTNVLAFPATDAPRVPGQPAQAGDLVICADVVAAEAAEQGKAPAAHWAHMVVHGSLHLMGYDHVDEDDAQRMESVERSALAALGYPDPYRDHVT